MKIFTDEAKSGTSDFFACFYELHKNDVLCQPGMWFFYVLYLFVFTVTLMFGYVGYYHVQTTWEQSHPGVGFDESIVGFIGTICLTLGWLLILATVVAIVLFMVMVAIGERIVRKREEMKRATVSMWEV